MVSIFPHSSAASNTWSRARAKKPPASNDRGSASESEEDVQEYSDESDDDALQQQIAQEMRSSPSRFNTGGP